MPSRSLTKPIDNPECRFIILAWISASDIFNKLEGWRLESPESNHKPIFENFLIGVSDSSSVRSREKERKDRESESEKGV